MLKIFLTRGVVRQRAGSTYLALK